MSNRDEKYIETIGAELVLAGFSELATKLSEANRYGSTGGEIISNIGRVFMEIKRDEPELYKIIEYEANLFFERYRDSFT